MKKQSKYGKDGLQVRNTVDNDKKRGLTVYVASEYISRYVQQFQH